MKLLRIDHTAINVKSLQNTFDWYNKVFGFEIIHKWTHTWMIGDQQIKIGVFERPEASVISDIGENIIAIQHFAFLTDKDGFEKAVEDLDRLGIPHEPVEDSGIAFSVFVIDPDGHLVEITYYY